MSKHEVGDTNTGHKAVSLRLAREEAQRIHAIARLAGTDINTVITVLLAAAVAGAQTEDEAKPKPKRARKK